jgi:hypothetical protein
VQQLSERFLLAWGKSLSQRRFVLFADYLFEAFDDVSFNSRERRDQSLISRINANQVGKCRQFSEHGFPLLA